MLLRGDGPEAAEVARLRGEGLVRALVGPVHTATSEPASAALRASALALLLPPARSPTDAVVGYEAARWMLVGGPAPDQVDVYALPGRSRRRFRGLRVHEGVLVPSTVMVVGGMSPARVVAITIPARTAADLARSRPEATALAELRRLARCGVAPAEVAATLEVMAGHRGLPRARHTVRAWAAGAGSVGAAPRDPVGVEDALHPADGGEHVVEMAGVGHLEGEA